MSDAIITSGAPYVTGANGTYFLLDTTATAEHRVWSNTAQVRIYFESGWKIANSTDGTVYFKQVTAEVCDPWDIPTSGWTTDIAAYQSYLSSLALQKTTDEDVTTVTLETVTEYSLTEDTVFQAGKTYYTRSGEGVTGNPYVYTAVEVTPGESITADTYYEAKIATLTTTKTVNVRTGNVKSQTDKVIISTAPVQDIHKRYSIPKIEVGNVYRFSFVKDFEALGYIKPTSEDWSEDSQAENDSDITRGVFRVDSQTNYYSLLLSGVDIYQNLYLPLGINKEVYEEDRKNWMNDDVWYRLINPMLPAQTYYIPTAIIEGIPDGNVAEYKRYQLLVDIGIFNDPDFLSEVVTCVNMLFKAHFGLPTAAELATYDSVWIPTSYYDFLDRTRKVNIQNFMSEHSEQYFNTLFRNEYNKLYTQNKQLKTQVKTYEDLVTELTT